jgi:hypothetical protein
VEVALGRVEGRRQRQGAEEAKQWAQLVLGDEGMQQTPTRGGQDDRRSAQPVVADKVKNMLESAGVGTAVNRRSHHDEIGSFDVFNDLTALRGQTIEGRCSEKSRPDVRQVKRQRIRGFEFLPGKFLNGIEEAYPVDSGSARCSV